MGSFVKTTLDMALVLNNSPDKVDDTRQPETIYIHTYVPQAMYLHTYMKIWKLKL